MLPAETMPKATRTKDTLDAPSLFTIGAMALHDGRGRSWEPGPRLALDSLPHEAQREALSQPRQRHVE
jgi:hypothetical protein